MEDGKEDAWKRLHFNPDDLVKEIAASGLISDRTRWRGRYRQCFSGEDLCAFLVSNGYANSAKHAVEVGSMLLQQGFIVKIYGGKDYFANSRGFYRIGNHPESPKAPDTVAPIAPGEQLEISDASTPDAKDGKMSRSPSTSSLSGFRTRVASMESSIRSLVDILKDTRVNLSEIRLRQDELTKVHNNLITATATLQQTLLKLVALCVVVFLVAKLIPEIVGGPLASGVGWICTCLAGAATIVLFGKFRSITKSTYNSNTSEAASGEISDQEHVHDSGVKNRNNEGNIDPTSKEEDKGGTSLRNPLTKGVSGRLGKKRVLYLDTDD